MDNAVVLFSHFYVLLNFHKKTEIYISGVTRRKIWARASHKGPLQQAEEVRLDPAGKKPSEVFKPKSGLIRFVF